MLHTIRGRANRLTAPTHVRQRARRSRTDHGRRSRRPAAPASKASEEPASRCLLWRRNSAVVEIVDAAVRVEPNPPFQRTPLERGLIDIRTSRSDSLERQRLKCSELRYRRLLFRDPPPRQSCQGGAHEIVIRLPESQFSNDSTNSRFAPWRWHLRFHSSNFVSQTDTGPVQNGPASLGSLASPAVIVASCRNVNGDAPFGLDAICLTSGRYRSTGSDN